MTKEQEAQQAEAIARIKEEYGKHIGRTYHAFADFSPLVTEVYTTIGVLLEIVDYQAQKLSEKAKQYTEAELRTAFSSQYQDGLHMGENGEFTSLGLEGDFGEWIECARFLGALKE